MAAQAKVSKGSLYQYFDDKMDLYRWLILEHLPARKQAVAPAVVVDGDLFAWLEGKG